MSKVDYLHRYLLIFEKLKSKQYPTFEEIERYIERKDILGDIAFSKRTLQRDMNEMKKLFNIEIKYCPIHKGYYIEDEENLEKEPFMRMLEAFEVFNAFNMIKDFNAYMDMEQRKAKGTEHFYILMHGIKNKLQLSFHYQKFYDHHTQKRTIEPYMLKEFKNRWYIIGKDVFDQKIKTFALDRLTTPEATNTKFMVPKDFSPTTFFKHCFGIINGENHEKVETILLSFDADEGKYIKTLPLHHSQEILKDTDKELQITLKLYPTFDFKKELLSFGYRVKVLQPEYLAEEIQHDLQEALNKYKQG